MKAVLLNNYGDPGQLVYGDAPDPIPGPDEVLVRVAGTSINPIDWKLRSGYMKDLMPLQFPAILGHDVAGEVVSVGADAKQFKVGDQVLGLVNRSYAELIATKPETLALIPDGLSMEQAAVIPLVTITGTQLIEKGVKPKAGDVVLVTGAAGPVGRTAVYIAKAHGATVIAGVRASQKAEARFLGADQVIALDNDEDLASLGELDAIADTIGGPVLAKLFSKLKKTTGVFASVLGKPAGADEAGVRVAQVFAQADSKRLGELAEDVRVNDLLIPIAARFKLSEIREAHAFAEKGAHGKVLLTP